MDKIQPINRIIEIHPKMKRKDAEKAVQVILGAQCGALAKGGRIEIRGFGSFSLKRLPPKIQRNTKTAFALKEPPKYLPCFKPAKELCAQVSENDKASSAESCPRQQISPSPFGHEAANNIEQSAIYA